MFTIEYRNRMGCLNLFGVASVIGGFNVRIENTNQVLVLKLRF